MRIEKIVSNGFCVGCGLCESVGVSGNYKMELNQEGFYTPKVTSLDKETEGIINKICPGINLETEKTKSVWGKVISIQNGWATDNIVRKKGSSGGVISALCIYLIETEKVDAILHVGNIEGHYLYNSLKISKSKEEILSNSSSRYAPALIFDKIIGIFQSNDDTYAFVGKPCDISGLQNFLKVFPQYTNRIKYTLSIFCAGIPSYHATEDLIKASKIHENPISLKYRGNGWPGDFNVTFSNGETFSKNYNESWGEVLGKQIHFRCKICPDGIGLCADIVAADSWETKNGYPDFSEKEGKSFIITRNKTGESILRQAEKDKYIEVEKLDLHEIKSIQPYQYEKRFIVGYRILGIQLCTFFALKFIGVNLFNKMINYNILKGIKISIGTIKRWIRKK